jgi:hypothetical protein
MKSKLAYIAAIASSAVLLSAGSAMATVTLQFSQTNVARATGFGDRNGVAQNGMAWGIIVDSAGNGFAGASVSTTYDLFSSGTTSGSGIQLTVGGVQTDDYYVSNASTTLNLTPTGSAGGTDPGGAGGITSLASIFSTYPSGVAAGDAFSIIWFDTSPNANGTYYGMMADASFTLPPDGNTTSYASVFAGTTADPVKTAQFQFGVAIPEPSRALLAGFGLLGFLMRRRRA